MLPPQVFAVPHRVTGINSDDTTQMARVFQEEAVKGEKNEDRKADEGRLCLPCKSLKLCHLYCQTSFITLEVLFLFLLSAFITYEQLYLMLKVLCCNAASDHILGLNLSNEIGFTQ